MITATCRSSAIYVLFGVQSNGDIRILSFQRGTTLKFLKYFRTFFISILGQRHGVIIPVKPIRMQSRSGGKSIFCASNMVCLLVFALSSHMAVMPGHSCPCLLVFCDPARLGRLAHMTPPPPAAAHTRISDACA